MYRHGGSCLMRRNVRASGVVGRPADLWVEARRGFSELLSKKKGFGDKKGGRSANMLKPGVISPPLPVPAGINRPPYAETKENPPWDDNYQVHDKQGIERMRRSGKLAAEVLEMAGKLVKSGTVTDDIDKAVHKMIIENGAYPSPLNYGGFPKSVCTSINECICHGIPDSRPLQDGDIVNIDVTVFLDGHHGDTSRMFLVGDSVSEEAKRLVEVTKESLDAAIAICRPGAAFKEIGSAIQKVANANKMNVVKSFVGHGVGRVFHSSPVILHYPNREKGVMEIGQTFTIEPMLTLGSIKPKIWADEWTAVTADGSLSAQFEHTLLITEDGVEILTKL